MSVPDVTLLIVHTREHLSVRQALRSLRRAAPKLYIEVLVIDSYPAQGLATVLKREFPEVHYVAKHDQGLDSALNVGKTHAKGRYVYVFSPEIIFSATALEKLVEYLEMQPNVGVVGPKVLLAEGTLQPTGWRFPLTGGSWGERFMSQSVMTDTEYEHTQEVDWLTLDCVLFRSDALARAGAFEGHHSFQFAEAEVCWRVWELGYKVVYYPEVVVIHYQHRAESKGAIFRHWHWPLTWLHLSGTYTFFRKYSGQANPREVPRLSQTSSGILTPDSPVSDQEGGRGGGSPS